MLTPAPRGFLCCGNLVLDVLARPVEKVAFGTSTWIDSIEQRPGGNGASTSFTLARLGAPVRLTGLVGRDTSGDLLLAELRAAGVDVSAVMRSSAPTPASVVLVRPDGARALLHRPGASREAFPAPLEFTPELTEGCSHFHLANVFALPLVRPHAAETLGRARAAGLTTSLDTGWDARGEWLRVLEPCLAGLDLLFVNEDEARMLTGVADPHAAAARLRELGARTVVVKLGARGSAVYAAHGETSAPAYAIDAVDTTGAGDCFVGAFLAALYHGETYASAARVANAAGALSTSKMGAVAGVLDWPETQAWMRTARMAEF